MKVKKTLQTLLIIGFVSFSGCDNIFTANSSDNSDIIISLESNLTINLAPSSSENELLTLVDNNNKFAFSIFDKLHKSEEGNIFFSPYSISEALAIVYAGAKGDTKTEIASVFNFNTVDEKNLYESFNALDLHLNSEDENYIFDLSNAIWIQNNYPVLDSYLDTIKVNYGAKVQAVDFVNKTEESRLAINEWVEEQTHQRIKDIIPEGGVNKSTPVVITNTVYFKGQWLNNFQKAYTKDDIFTLENGFSTETTFMNQYDGNYKYLKESYYQAIELPYKGKKSSMVIILPDKNELLNTIDNIESIYKNIAPMSYQNIILKMPKFEFSTPAYDIKEYLKTLGMITPFYQGADFTNMTSDANLFIDSIAHKAFIVVDEDGIEAAAATAVVDSNISGVANQITFDINRAFILFIKDNMSGQILFMGLIKEPTP